MAEVTQMVISTLNAFADKLRLKNYTNLENKIEKTQLEKVRFIKVNELKLTQVELF